MLCNSGKRKGSDSDSYDEEDGVEGGFQIASDSDDMVEKGVIAASKFSTLVCCRKLADVFKLLIVEN